MKPSSPSPAENHPEQRPPNLTVCVLASGSRGNAIYIAGGDTAILVDAGLSGVELQRRMGTHDLDPRRLNAILVSHEHGDHIQGVGILARRFDLPVYASAQTAAAGTRQLGKIARLNPFECGAAFRVGQLTIRPFSLSHDAADTAGFTIERNGAKIGIATDLGIATSLVKSHLKHCGILILEANHDPDMLIDGPYPWHLKQRIKGRSGHLSNRDCRRLLREVRHDGLRHVILAHLSEKNNTPTHARAAVAPEVETHAITLTISRQDRCGPIVTC